MSRARAIEMLRSRYPLEVLLHVSGLAKSTFYYQRNCLYHRVDKYAHIREQIHDLWTKNDGKIGVVRMHGALRQKQVISRKVIRRLMREEGLEPTVRVKKNKRRNQTGFISQVAPNILNRCFHPDKANTAWVSDVSIFIIAGKRLYLSPVIDLCGGQVLSYTLSTRHSPAFVTESLKDAFDKYTPAPGLIVHTDQGINYHHESWRKLIHDHGAIQSMSRRGNCHDNAMAENFFSHLKSELPEHAWESIEALREAIPVYIHHYNTQRNQERLNHATPTQYRLQHAA